MSIITGQTILASDLFHMRKVSLTASEGITAGAPVGISNIIDNYVARALTESRVATTTPTTDDGGGCYPCACVIDTDKFVLLYRETTTSYLRAVVVTVSYTDLANPFTYGTPVTISTTALAGVYGTTFFDICKLGTGKFGVAYVESGATTVTRLVIATVSGTTITLGTAVNFDSSANAVRGLCIAQIATDKGVICAGKSTPYTRAFTVSGTTATIGASVALGTNIANQCLVACLIATDKFVVSDDATGYAQVGTISGTTITIGTQVQYNSAVTQAAYMHHIWSPASNVFVVGYQKSSNLFYSACTVSGTVITAGTAFDTGFTGARFSLNISSTVFYGTGNNSVVQYALSGTTITTTKTLIDRIGIGTMRYGFVDLGSSNWLIGGWGATSLTYFIKGMSNNFLGIAQSTVAKGATVDVLVRGIDANQSGLVAGATYLVSSTGLTLISTTTTVNTLDDIGVVKALSATQILL